MHHALVQPVVTDLKRKSIVGGMPPSQPKVRSCCADDDDNCVGAIVVTGGFWIAGNSGCGDRFSRAFQTGRLSTYREDLDQGVLCDFPLVADLFPVGAQTGRQRSAHSF